MVPAGIWGPLFPMPKRADSQASVKGLLPNWPLGGQTSGEGWEVAFTLSRPEQGKARYQGWPCWHRAEGMGNLLVRSFVVRKEQPASSHLRGWEEKGVRPPSPSHPSRWFSGQPEDPAWAGGDGKQCHCGVLTVPLATAAQLVKGDTGSALFCWLCHWLVTCWFPNQELRPDPSTVRA